MPHNPVLLIHGIWRKHTVFNQMYQYLCNQGYQVHRFDLTPSSGRVGIDRLAWQIDDYVKHNLPKAQLFDLVGLSMGGLVARYYVQKIADIRRVQNLITVGSPHQGTWWAYALPDIAYQQMRPQSDFLQDLNQNIEKLEQLNFTAIWTPFDFIIVPAESSILGIGKTIMIPVFAHAMLIRDPRVHRAIANILSARG